MHRLSWSLCLLVLLPAVTSVGCWGCSPQLATAPADGEQAVQREPFVPRSVELIREHNRGVALMGRLRRPALAEAESIFAGLARRHPAWLDVQVDRAIAKFNQQEADGERTSAYITDSLAIFQQVLRDDPDHPRAHYCAGILYLYQGQPDKALTHFEKVADADPQDAYAAYLVGRCLFDTRRREEALEWFQQAMRLDPYLYSAYYNASVSLRLLARPDEAAEVSRAAERLFHNPLARTYKEVYSRFGPKGEVRGLPLADPRDQPSPEGALFTEPEPLELSNAVAARWLESSEDTTHRPSVTVCDIDGDGQLDLFVTGAITADSQRHNAVLLARAGGWFADLAHPLASVSDVNAALWGDYDNDAQTDVYLCRGGGNQLWRQVAPNAWEDVTTSTGTGGGERNTVDGAVFDADHDGDLDYYLVNADGPNELLNNNLNGTFRALAAQQGIAGDGRASRRVITTDLDNDRDVDLVIINEQPPHEVYLNDRLWEYHPAEGVEALVAAAVDAAVAADADRDGEVELYTLSPSAITRWKRDAQGVWQSQALLDTSSQDVPYHIPTRLAVADVNGDGDLELIHTAGDGWVVLSLDKDQPRRIAESTSFQLLDWFVATLNAPGEQIVGLPGGQPPVVWRAGPGRQPVTRLMFTGRHADEPKMRSNFSGIGVRTAARKGADWTLRDTYRSDSGPGQSLQPLAFGLGGQQQLDFISLYWSDGVLQTEGGPGGEVALDDSGVHLIEEINREPTSCPLLFVWDGERYAFVSDLLAGGGLGYNLGRGHYATSDPTESFLLPEGLARPRAGAFQIKLAEPLEELSYIDQVQLVAYDLPPGWRMSVDERMAGDDPQPTGKAVFYRHEMAPIEAVTHAGEDVTAALRAVDRVAAPPGTPDPRFLGRTQYWSVTLRFATPIDVPSAGARAAQPVLVADGWIEFPYSQTMFAAWQAGASYQVPQLEARAAGGRWQIVHAAFGYPGGMPREMSVPLSELPTGTTELRISTNHEIYWDRLRVVWAEACPMARRQRLPLTVARLRHAGFPHRSTGPQRVHSIDYARRRLLADVRHPAGLYTAFGAVDELVADREGGLAIFGPGEELHLEFESLSPAATGWSRRLVLEVVGWCKDMDLFTQHGETVTPLPTEASYPPGSSTSREELHSRYNTRFETGR